MPLSSKFNTFLAFGLTYALLLVIFLASLGMTGETRDFWLKEGGIIETFSAAGYPICIGFILAKRGLRELIFFALLFAFFGLRELDFDARFTTRGILTSMFYVDGNVPLMEKLIAGPVVLLLLFTVGSIVRNYWRVFFRELWRFSTEAVGAFLVMGMLFVSLMVDGLGRKLAVINIHISESFAMHAGAFEEILELGIPVIIFLTLNAYFARTAPQINKT